MLVNEKVDDLCPCEAEEVNVSVPEVLRENEVDADRSGVAREKERVFRRSVSDSVAVEPFLERVSEDEKVSDGDGVVDLLELFETDVESVRACDLVQDSDGDFRGSLADNVEDRRESVTVTVPVGLG